MSPTTRFLAISTIIAMSFGCNVPDPEPGQVLAEGYEAPPAHRVATDVAYGPGATQLLDIYYPEQQTAGVILFLHAGGWCCGSKEGVSQIALRQVSRGWVLVSVEYALTSWPEGSKSAVNPFPAALYDTKRAIRFIKAHGADDYGIDSSIIVPWGESAGGTLAILAATSAGSLEPPELPAALIAENSIVQAAVSLAGPLAFESWLKLSHPWVPSLGTAFLDCAVQNDVTSCDPEVVAAASAHTYYDRYDAPVYLAYGELDSLVPPSTTIPLAVEYLRAGLEDYAWIDTVEGFGHNLGSGANVAMLELGLDVIGDGGGSSPPNSRPITETEFDVLSSADPALVRALSQGEPDMLGEAGMAGAEPSTMSAGCQATSTLNFGQVLLLAGIGLPWLSRRRRNRAP